MVIIHSYYLYRQSSYEKEMLIKMITSGVNAFRFNFAQYKRDFQDEALKSLREALEQTPNAKVALMMDT